VFVRNSWYVAAWDFEVPQIGMLSRTLLNEPIVFYRNTKGLVIALENRCCHRFAPLHLGRQEGDCIRCMYHGLKYDSTGACIEIPGQENIPPKAFIKNYPIIEKDRLIWIWMGDVNKANPQNILDYHWHDSKDWKMKPGYIYYKSNYKLIIDNLLDFTHLAWVHPTTLGTESAANLKPTITRNTDGNGTLSISRWYLDDQMPNLHKKFAKFKGNVDRWQIYEWSPPGLLRMDAGSAPAGTGAQEGIRVSEALQFRHTSIQTPETDQTTHYWFCQARNFELDDDQITESIFESVLEAFEEDRTMIEAQQKIIDLNNDRHMVPIAADQGLKQARWLIDRLLEAEANEGGFGDKTSKEKSIISLNEIK
jgi:phenylpropionate dioxygenase-like ring-hydroxylating dioxygenase large terminal subunit